VTLRRERGGFVEIVLEGWEAGSEDVVVALEAGVVDEKLGEGGAQ